MGISSYTSSPRTKVFICFFPPIDSNTERCVLKILFLYIGYCSLLMSSWFHNEDAMCIDFFSVWYSSGLKSRDQTASLQCFFVFFLPVIICFSENDTIKHIKNQVRFNKIAFGFASLLFLVARSGTQTLSNSSPFKFQSFKRG